MPLRPVVRFARTVAEDPCSRHSSVLLLTRGPSAVLADSWLATEPSPLWLFGSQTFGYEVEGCWGQITWDPEGPCRGHCIRRRGQVEVVRSSQILSCSEGGVRWFPEWKWDRNRRGPRSLQGPAWAMKGWNGTFSPTGRELRVRRCREERGAQFWMHWVWFGC